MSTETQTAEFSRFAEFYPYYLREHSNRTCRRLHFAGSWGVLAVLLTGLWTGNPWWFLGMPLIGYGCAWVGHFFFEHNKPATFRYPAWSLLGDWVMFKDILIGRVRI